MERSAVPFAGPNKYWVEWSQINWKYIWRSFVDQNGIYHPFGLCRPKVSYCDLNLGYLISFVVSLLLNNLSEISTNKENESEMSPELIPTVLV